VQPEQAAELAGSLIQHRFRACPDSSLCSALARKVNPAGRNRFRLRLIRAFVPERAWVALSHAHACVTPQPGGDAIAENW